MRGGLQKGADKDRANQDISTSSAPAAGAVVDPEFMKSSSSLSSSCCVFAARLLSSRGCLPPRAPLPDSPPRVLCAPPLAAPRGAPRPRPAAVPRSLMNLGAGACVLTTGSFLWFSWRRLSFEEGYFELIERLTIFLIATRENYPFLLLRVALPSTSRRSFVGVSWAPRSRTRWQFGHLHYIHQLNTDCGHLPVRTLR